MKTGERIGPYRIVRRIGAGGMGDVFEAVEESLDRTVALKQLKAELAGSPEVLQRFNSEARLLAQLEHPNIATIFTLIQQDSGAVLVMEYVGGGDLDALLRRRGRLETEEACGLVRQALAGIQHAHAAGIVHRDLKPSNAMLSTSGVLKLVDFGIARAVGAARLTRAGHLVGTLEYMAPEVVLGAEGDHRSDLYALGIMLHELLTGRAPFTADTDYELIRAQVENQPPRLSDLGVGADAGLQAVLDRALAKDPDARFQSAGEFDEALAAFAPTPQLATTRPQSHIERMAWLRRLGTGFASLPAVVAAKLTTRSLVIAAAVLGGVVLFEAAILLWSPGEVASVTRPVEPHASPVVSQTPPATERRRNSGVRRTTPTASTPTRPPPPPERNSRPLPPPAKEKEAPPSSSGNDSPQSKPKASERVEEVVQEKPKPKQPQRPRAKIVKASVHESMRKGRFARAAGYNIRVDLSAAARVNEYYEVSQAGRRVLRLLVASEQRRSGSFQSKQRVPQLKDLADGTYQARIVLEVNGVAIASHRFVLEVR